MGVVQGAAVMLGSWLRSSRSHTSSTPSARATYITPAPPQPQSSLKQRQSMSGKLINLCYHKRINAEFITRVLQVETVKPQLSGYDHSLYTFTANAERISTE